MPPIMIGCSMLSIFVTRVLRTILRLLRLEQEVQGMKYR